MDIWNYIILYLLTCLLVRGFVYICVDDNDYIPFIGNISKLSRGLRITARMAMFFLWFIWIPLILVVIAFELIFISIYSMFK